MTSFYSLWPSPNFQGPGSRQCCQTAEVKGQHVFTCSETDHFASDWYITRRPIWEYKACCAEQIYIWSNETLPWKVVIFMILALQFIWCIPVSPLNHTHKTQTHSTSVTAINSVIVTAPADETEYSLAGPRTHRHTTNMHNSQHTQIPRGFFAELRRHKQTARVCGGAQKNEK